MKRAIVYGVVALIATASAQPALAIKEFGEHFGKYYVEPSKNEEFKKLVGEAKCNVCHIEGENKKKHNPYGDELKELGLVKKTFTKERFKGEADKVRKEIEEILKKAEDSKAKGSDETFGKKIQEGKLPGGDKNGK